MTRADEMAEQLKGSIIEKLGVDGEKIFEGKEAPSNPVKRARWVKTVMRNLDEAVDKETRFDVMHVNGVNCADHNAKVVKAAVARRGKHGTLDEFLDSEIRKPQAGTSIERDGDGLILSYLPANFKHPMRCFCSLVNALPEGETLSSTYCQCSVAFVETWWSRVVGKPVKVSLLESAVTGSDKCRFRITW